MSLFEHICDERADMERVNATQAESIHNMQKLLQAEREAFGLVTGHAQVMKTQTAQMQEIAQELKDLGQTEGSSLLQIASNN